MLHLEDDFRYLDHEIDIMLVYALVLFCFLVTCFLIIEDGTF